MLTLKYLKIAISTAMAAVIVAVNPVMILAADVEEVSVLGTGSSATDLEEVRSALLESEITGDEIIYGIDDEEIWALIDKDDLRSFVDVDTIREAIDKEAILEEIDFEMLAEKIDEEDLARQVDTDQHPVDIVNTKMPIIGEESPFDFIIDPMKLVHDTDAAKYGAGRVEEGASILFKNKDGDYLFSSKSDLLTISNQGNIPVQLTIRAKINSAGGVEFVGSRSELGGADPQIFMALCDKDGIRSVLTEDGEARIDVVLDAVPDDSYSFVWNEEEGKYDYKVSEDFDEDDYDSFSFQIYGDCNTEGKWTDIGDAPTIVVSWEAVPVHPEKDKLDETVEQYSSEIEMKVSDYLAKQSDQEKELSTDQAKERNEKIEKLRREALIELANAQFKAMLEEELRRLVDDEVEVLATEEYKELRAEKIRQLLEEAENANEDTNEDANEDANKDANAEEVAEELTDESISQKTTPEEASMQDETEKETESGPEKEASEVSPVSNNENEPADNAASDEAIIFGE